MMVNGHDTITLDMEGGLILIRHIKLEKIKMKFKLVAISLLTLFPGISSAQSGFEGSYGQVSTGYEYNSASSTRLTGTDNGAAPNVSNSPKPHSGSAPLIFGFGYTFLVRSNVTLGIGLDYSALPQDTSPEGYNYSVLPGVSFDYKFTVSDRLNIFIAPGYVIEKNKLAYAKLGYSRQNVQYTQTNCCSFPSNVDSVNGYVLGLGYKQIIDRGLYGFAEVTYHAYRNADLSSTYTNGPGGTVSSNPRFDAYNVLLGLGYRF